MKLLTKEILKKIPKLYEEENVKIPEKTLWVKLFTPWTNWTWYIAEYDPESKLAFGYVEGFENEWGYFDLSELEEITGIGGLKVERDRWFEPKRFSELNTKQGA
jgi:Protein of unknown function (DUF2958)